MLFTHVSTPTVRIWWNQWGAMAASRCNSLMKVMVWYLESDTHNVQLFFMCLFWFGLTWDFGYLHTVFVKFLCNLIDFSLCNHSDSRGGIMMRSFSWNSMYRVLIILQEIRMERSCFWSCSHLHDIWSCWSTCLWYATSRTRIREWRGKEAVGSLFFFHTFRDALWAFSCHESLYCPWTFRLWVPLRPVLSLFLLFLLYH